MQSIFFHVPMEPKGSPRPRTTKTGHVFMPAGYMAWKKAFASYATQSMPDAALPWWPGKTPLELDVDIKVKMPKSWSIKKQCEHLGRGIAQKPDIDNILKSVMDALNGVAWEDDAQVTRVSVSTKWSLSETYIAVRISSEVHPNAADQNA